MEQEQQHSAAAWTEQVFFLGVPGTGKSWKAQRQVEVICRAKHDTWGNLVARRLVVHDPTGSWRRELNLRDDRGNRIELDPWRENRRTHPFTFIDNDADLVLAMQREEDCVFAFDELGEVDDIAGASRIFRGMCRMRRHRRLTIMACAQRPSRIPVEAYAFCTRVLIFRIQHRDDLERLASLWPTREAAKRAIETISNLSIQRHQFLMLRMTEKQEKQEENHKP